MFPHTSSMVTDNKDHFPINDIKQARNALSRANQYDKVPKWYKGSLQSLVSKVKSTVESAYPKIKTTAASGKPGKG